MTMIGEIRVFAFSFAPAGWLPCAGQTLQVSDYPELFAAIGAIYGGDSAAATFNLPDLRSRVMMNTDPQEADIKSIGVSGGVENVLLIPETSAPHSHSLNIGTTPDSMAVNGASIASSVAMENTGMGAVLSFSDPVSMTTLNIGTLDNSGGASAHENRMPSLALNVCIAATGQALNTGMPYVGEIRAFPFQVCPQGWKVCDGSMLQSDLYGALASLLGTTFGGNAQEFALPNLIGSVVVANGQGTGLSSYTLGQAFGQESVSLTVDEMPVHNHKIALCNDTAISATVQGELTYLAARECPVEGSLNSFIPAGQNRETQVLHEDTIGTSTGGAHENRQPFLAINYLICGYGDYPQQG